MPSRTRARSVVPAYLRVTLTCPLCRHRVPLDVFTEKLATVHPAEPEFWRLWPRKPDGSRGFHWERLEPDQLHQVEVRVLEGSRFDDMWTRMLARVTSAMLAWLDRYGIDAAGHRLSVRVAPRPD
jgi:hypothetical protein